MIGQYGEPNESQPIPMTVPVAALREMIAQANADHDWVNDGCCPGLCRRCRARNSLAYTIWPTAASLLRRLDRAEAVNDAAEMLWAVVANVSGGDWTKQSQEWQDAAARWRDVYFDANRAYRAEGEEVGG